MTDWLAALFYRALFASNPPPDGPGHATRLLAVTRSAAPGKKPARRPRKA